MLGGLYGDLPPPSTAEEDGGGGGSSMWSGSSAKMAPPTVRKPSLFAPPPSVLRNQSASKPKTAPSAVIGATPSKVGRWVLDGSASPLVSAVEVERDFRPPSPPAQPALVGASAAVLEEYDPARPNDYDEYCRERRRRKMEEEMRREVERRRIEEEERERERERELQRQREVERERELEREKESGPERAAALHISGEEAWKRRAMLSAASAAARGGGGGGSTVDVSPARPRSPSPPRNAEGFSMGKSNTGGLGVGAGGHMTAAQRMMARMGWKEGQGLGKQEQGITTPLMARKTDKRAGVIVNAGEAKAQQQQLQQQQQQEKKAKVGVSISGPPTRVVLLRNMVGPGEVDGELEDEVASECTKYGTVTRVLIFEITEPDFPVTEAVRIFVQFERAEQATKALVDLDGRFFGGRVVRASFYDVERFARNELAPLPGEVPVANSIQ